MDFSITTQKNLEETFSKYQLMSCLKAEFINAGFPAMLADVDIPVGFGLDLLIQAYLHKRTSISVMTAILRRHFEEDEENPAQACADMILRAAEKDLIDWDDPTQSIIMKYTVSPDVEESLSMFQYPLPMIEEPETVRNNRQTGYQTIHGSMLLRDNHHDEDICLDHINRTNKIPLALNANVVSFVQNKWKNLDKPKTGETYEEFKKRKAAFERYDKSSRDVIKALQLQGDRFWLTHKYDKRGRTYAQGYHVNYQGNDWCKAVVEFADKETLNGM